MILSVFVLIFSMYIVSFNIYNILISLFGFKKSKRDYEIIPDKTRFLILIAAHNEEQVIGATLSNLRNIKYNPELYDLVVVNDNSTDKTGDICDEFSIQHIDTIKREFTREGVGKPAGIQYALRKIGFDIITKKYDLIMILDADNFVDEDILKELNSQWVAKNQPEVIQTYLGVKNSSSTMARGYAYSYWSTNRFFQLAKYRIGLPCAIGGTGFVVRADYLINKGGFCFQSLVEDLELSIEVVKDHGRIIWNHHVGIYDEKPDNLKTSLIQRYRWSKGHWFVAFKNFKQLLLLLFKERKLKYLDQLIYLFSMGKPLQIVFALMNILILIILNVVFFDANIFDYTQNKIISYALTFNLISLVLLFYGLVLLPFLGATIDGKQKITLMMIPKMTLSLLYFGITFMVAQLLGLIFWRRQSNWVRTPHTKNKIQ